MSETHTIHDPFLKQDVEVSSKLTDRLRGKYACGPIMPNGEPEFGWRQFETPPVQHEAATALEAQAKEIEVLKQSLDDVVNVDNSLAQQLRKSIESNAALKSRAETAERRVADLTDYIKSWTSPSEMRQRAGEMTAQEVRTVQAILSAILDHARAARAVIKQVE